MNIRKDKSFHHLPFLCNNRYKSYRKEKVILSRHMVMVGSQDTAGRFILLLEAIYHAFICDLMAESRMQETYSEGMQHQTFAYISSI